MKILLVGFKLSIGNELYMNTLYSHLEKNKFDVDICGDSNYIRKYHIGTAIANGGNSMQMVIDTINPLNWLKIYKLLRKNKYDKVFFVASHTLNNIVALIAKILNIEVISHIHDPLPHSGTRYGFIIFLSQIIQSKFSNKIVVYGEYLKNIIVEKYKINAEKVYVIKHGVYRENREVLSIQKNKKYVSLLGRIDKYKGIDIFLKAIEKIDKKIDKNIKFVIGGKGDLFPYTNLISKVQHRLIIKNYLISNEEFDEILINSYFLVLPYKDGTQTGNIQVAYYNACPVIVSKVGSLPELVEEGKTGYLINPNDEDELAIKIIRLLDSDYIEMGYNAFNYYKKYLRWDKIIKDFIEILGFDNDSKK